MYVHLGPWAPVPQVFRSPRRGVVRLFGAGSFSILHAAPRRRTQHCQQPGDPLPPPHARAKKSLPLFCALFFSRQTSHAQSHYFLRFGNRGMHDQLSSSGRASTDQRTFPMVGARRRVYFLQNDGIKLCKLSHFKVCWFRNLDSGIIGVFLLLLRCCCPHHYGQHPLKGGQEHSCVTRNV